MSRWPGRLITKNPVTPGGVSPTASAPGVWTLPEMAYWKKQGLWPDPSADAYWGYVSYLMATSSLSNANNNLFVDSSSAFNPVARNGNATQGAVTPYGTLWSNYFDGSSYITMASGTAAGTGDFTIEGWFNVASYSTGPGLYDTRPFLGNGAYPAVFVDASGYLTYYVNTATQIQGATLVGLNTWNHFAVCRSGTSTRLFLNGVQQGSTYTDTNNYQMGASRPIVGGNGYYPGLYSQLTGYVSNIRVVNGTALYTTAFTPPASPLTAISGTVLLTCQSNRFRDASSYNVSVSVSGSPQVSPFSPFVLNAPGAVYNQNDISYWSGYFNGSSYLTSATATAPGTGDFTVEGWFNMSSIGSTRIMYDARPAGTNGAYQTIYVDLNGYLSLYANSADQIKSTNVVPLNAWNHFALCRSGTSTKLFLNGVQQGSTYTDTNNWLIGTSRPAIGTDGFNLTGNFFTGYLSNIRSVNGTALYTTTFTPPTAPLTAISGTSLLTCQSAAFTDNSTNNYVLTQGGSPTVTGNNPFQNGYYSNYFDGSGDYLTTPSNAAFAYGTGDFTWEMWVFPTGANWTTTGNYYLMDHGSNGGTLSYYQNVIRYYNSTTGTGSVLYTNGGTIPANQWTHVAVSRSGGTTSLFVNGALRTSASDSYNYGTAAVTLANYGGGGLEFQGYISNARIVKGTAVYTGAFTPSTTPLTAITNTSLLTCQSSRFIDSSANAFALTKVGNTSVSPFDPFYTATVASNGGSMYFDGNGDYLSAPNSPGFQFGAGNFTIELWAYLTATGGSGRGLISKGTTTGASFLIYQGSSNELAFYASSNGSSWDISSNQQFSSNIPLNTWHHIAVSRSGTTFRLFLNGALTTSFTSSAALVTNASSVDIGTFGSLAVNGYLSDVRLTSGTALYTGSFTPPTAPLTPSGNTTLLLNGMNAGTYDAGMQNNLETVGNAQVSSAQAKYGTTSVYFDGSGDYLRLPQGQNLSSGNWTIEFWVYFNSFTGTTTPHVFNFGTDSNNRYGVYRNTTGKLSFFTANSGSFDIKDGTTTVAINTWYHVAVVSNGGTRTMYVNGTSEATSTSAINAGTNWVLGFMQFGSASTDYLNGYLDDFRITKGYARYTANFTPPTAALPVY